MSGLGKIGGLPGFVGAGDQVADADIDQYVQYVVFAPSADTSYMGTVTTSTSGAFVSKNKYPDYPRNLLYSVTGGATGMGGTFTAVFQNFFGEIQNESVTIGSANGGGTTQGTAICARFIAGTFASNGSGSGTAAIGFGTASGSTGNWFGLPSKIAGTSDIKLLTWISTNTPTTLAGGTAFGTLVNTTTHAFQGTSGVANTDRYVVLMDPSFDNTSRGKMVGL